MKLFTWCLAALVVLQSFNCSNSVSDGNPAVVDSLPKFSSYIRDSLATVDSLEIHFYIPVNAHAEVTTARPLKGDSSVIFVCAAAFTRLDNGLIDGLFIENGIVIVRNVNRTLGGGIIISSSTSKHVPEILGTEMGARLDSAFVDSMVNIGASFFQQIQMVRDGQSLVFRKDVSRFQRRAICIWHGQPVIIESTLPCTLQKFADVMKNCGIQNALYLDMGSWDEGWFRDENFELHTIGQMRNQTKKQSNWLKFVAG